MKNITFKINSLNAKLIGVKGDNVQYFFDCDLVDEISKLFYDKIETRLDVQLQHQTYNQVQSEFQKKFSKENIYN